MLQGPIIVHGNSLSADGFLGHLIRQDPVFLSLLTPLPFLHLQVKIFALKEAYFLNINTQLPSD